MFCPNCGVQLGSCVNFCPNCGTKVATVVAAKAAEKDNMVMLVSLGTCARTTAAALLSHVCGYTADEALLIVDNVPITVARGLTDAQARYLAQAFTEYGLEVSIYDGEGWRDLESDSESVWDQTGALLAGVASALGLLGLNNRITREMMHRTEFPYRYQGTRPPVYRLNSTLRVAQPRRIAPVQVRPPVRHAPPAPTPRPAPAPRPAPVQRPAPAPVRPVTNARPAPAPVQRPAPAPVRPANTARPAPAPAQRPAPAPVRPTNPAPRTGNVSAGRTGNGTPGGRPGGGTGRRG